MDFPESYTYFFENNGKCPLCKGYMSPQSGCKNLECPEVIAILADRSIALRRRRQEILHHWRYINKYRKRWAEFVEEKREMRRKAREKRNIDNAVKKTYSLIEEEL
jgi:hypothetical protein